jgi:ribonucleoside-diphosphate reductase alpha chain
MDCDTTGIEPDLALVKYKWLVGGGMLKIVNQTVPEALKRLGYNPAEVQAILKYIDETDTIEGAPHLKDEHLPVFDCAFKAARGKRTIHYMAHIHMMAAVQPFVSGAISKTVNMPHDATVEEIEKVYLEGWKTGLKAIAIYRDGSKRQQALTTSKEKDAKKANEGIKGSEGLEVAKVTASVSESLKPSQPPSLPSSSSVPSTASIPSTPDFKPRRRRLPDERRAITHKFAIGNHEGYLTVGLYDDGSPGELFVTIAKEGSVISGLMDSFAQAVSVGLQYGVPLEVLVNKFVHARFEPSGYTSNPNIKIAKSIVDYIFRWMALKFLPPEMQAQVGVNVPKPIEITNGNGSEPAAATIEKTDAQPKLFDAGKKSLTGTFNNQADAPVCDTCGSIMVRNAACYKCLNCGGTSGCS